MRLQPRQIAALKRLAEEQFGPQARLRLFGSRLDGQAKGGDVDLLVELPVPVPQPALQSARLAARLSRVLDGRRVDVLLSAPNLARLPIHDIAMRQGRLL